MSYGRHQSFYIKENWINKFYLSIERLGLDFLLNNDHYKDLGIGKNMFASLRYWIEAFDLARISRQSVELTLFGELVGLYDPAVEHNFTKNIAHYNLVSKVADEDIFSHSFYYFFNVYGDSIIDKTDLQQKISEWNELTLNNREVSENTISRDIDCIIATYSNREKNHPEDLNVSLLADLGLIRKRGNTAYQGEIYSKKLSYDAVYYIILMNTSNTEIPIADLEKAENNIGKVFNLSRTRIIHILEDMITKGYPMRLTRTNNLDTLVLDEVINPNQFLKKTMEEINAN